MVYYSKAELKLNAARQIIENGALPRDVYGALGVSRQLMYYWRKKFNDPAYRSGGHGGTRPTKWSIPQRERMEIILLLYWAEKPMKPLDYFQRKLRSHRYVVSITTISRQFKRWGIRRKKIYHKMKAKFTQENMQYYLEYLISIQHYDPTKIHFLDEAHYDYRGLWGNKVWGVAGAEYEIADANFIDKRYTVTLFTSLNGSSPLIFTVTENKNTAAGFLRFVIELISQGSLRRGEILVVDNARVHTAHEMLTILDYVFDHFGIFLVFLPTYSPEFNPCELFFAQSKGWIRRNRDNLKSNSFLVEIIFSFAQYNNTEICAAHYRHCREIYKKNMIRIDEQL